MKKKKSILLAILLMAVGFAAVTTNLIINGSTVIGTNANEFEIIFTKALLDNENKTNEIISGDKKTITFTTKDLKDIGDKIILSRKSVQDEVLDWVKNELEPGKVVNGIVKNIRKYGVIKNFIIYL